MGIKGFQEGHIDFVSAEARKRQGQKVSKMMKGKVPIIAGWNKGKKIQTNTGRTHFKSEDISGEKHWNWKGGKSKCMDCGKQLTDYKTRRCNKCSGKAMMGENHPCWKGGISRDIHSVNEPKYKKWRNDIFARDNWTCRINDKDCVSDIQAHHILPWRDFLELRYNIKNGITLCLAHHPRKRAEEKRLIPVFQDLVSVSNEHH